MVLGLIETGLTLEAERIEQIIYSPGIQLRGLVKKHADGNYRVEVQKFYREESIALGPQER